MRSVIDDTVVERAAALRAEGHSWPKVGRMMKRSGAALAAAFRGRGIATSRAVTPNRTFDEKLLSKCLALRASGIGSSMCGR